ncbi:hypothetical protein XENTR_v10019213 [Xenopus tropicalis]|nr:hypothetical protein XENTR_v10019213 [Xenopus tropicalis]
MTCLLNQLNIYRVSNYLCSLSRLQPFFLAVGYFALGQLPLRSQPQFGIATKGYTVFRLIAHSVMAGNIFVSREVLETALLPL